MATRSCRGRELRSSDRLQQEPPCALAELPPEMLALILCYCDAVSLFQLERAFPYLKHQCSRAALFRRMILDASSWKEISWKDIKPFLYKNKNTSTTFQALNCCYLEHKMLYKMLLTMKNLRCVDIYGIKLTVVEIETLSHTLPKLQCIHNMSDSQLYAVGAIALRFNEVKPPNYLHFQLFEPLDVSAMNKVFFYLYEQPLVTEDSELQFHISFPEVQTLSHINLDRVLIGHKVKTFSLTINNFLHQHHTFRCIINSHHFLNAYNIFIESYDHILLSACFYKAVMDSPYVGFVDEESHFLVNISSKCFPLNMKYCFAVFVVKVGDDENMTRLLNRIYARIKLRHDICVLPQMICATPSSMNQSLDKLQCVHDKRAFIVPSCVLISEGQGIDLSHKFFKKPRISKVTTAVDVLGPIFKNKPSIETVIINDQEQDHVYLNKAVESLNFTNLTSIALLKNLKYLFLNIVPLEFQTEFFVDIFNHCPLIGLFIETKKLTDRGTDGLAMNLKLCKNLKILALRNVYVKNISKVLEGISECTILEHIELLNLNHLANRVVAPSMKSLETLATRCKYLQYFVIKLPLLEKEKRLMRRCEKIIKTIRPGIHVNLMDMDISRYYPNVVPLYQNDPFHKE